MTAAVAGVALAAALASGPYRRGALVGASSVSLSAFASMLLVQRGARSRKPLQAALLVMTLMFLARIVLVALGTVLVVRSGESIIAFIVAFFVPFFIFAAIEGWYLHSLSGPGTTA
jgi:hypothetical protein